MTSQDERDLRTRRFAANEAAGSDDTNNNTPALHNVENWPSLSHESSERPSQISDDSNVLERDDTDRSSIDMQQLRNVWGAAHANVFGTTDSVVPNAKKLTSSRSLGVTAHQPLLGEMEKSNLSIGRSTTYSSLIGSNSDINGVSSIIHDAARITHWDDVLTLCESNPECASYAGRDGWTALHHACNRRCPRPEVAEALINAYPAALLQEEDKGWLPLHYACRFKAPNSVVRLLCNLYPESGKAAVAKADKLGRTPLYYAIRYDAPDGVVAALLEVDPSVVLEEDQNEESPLALVWDNWAEKLEGKRLISSYLNGAFDETDDNTVHSQRAVLLQKKLESDSKLRKRWLKVNVLLKAAFGFRVEDEEDTEESSQYAAIVADEQRVWRIVHATAAVKCHLSLFLLALALHPEQAREYDEYDLRRPGDKVVEQSDRSSVRQTALHLAASSNAGGETGKTVLIRLLSLYQSAAEEQDGITGSLPLHLMVSNTKKQDWPNHAGLLYHFYPRAVQIADNDGKLPLHRASAVIRHRNNVEDYAEKSDVVQLVRAYPQATLKPDNAGCLPFHYVAAHAVIWDDDVESVYSVNRNAVQTRAGILFKNRLPMHMASRNIHSRDSLIQKLSHLHPRGASIPDSEGKLPFHLACEIGKDWEIGGVRCIYDAFPNAIRQPESNSREWLPLHMAAACRRPTGHLIEKLVELHTEASLVPDQEGQFPLHLACGAGKSLEGGLKVLFEANASALNSFDKKQQLPFYIAAILYCRGNPSCAETATIKPIPSVAALHEKTVNTEEAAELDIMYQLLRADPSTVLSFTS